MKGRFKSFSAVLPIVLHSNKILLARRKNTGFMDGKWDIAGSGHIEEKESALDAVIREVKEEVGITAVCEDVKLAHLCHKVDKDGDNTYYNIYFIIEKFTGEPVIAEPHKCSKLEWFDIKNLPSDLIPDRASSIKAYFNGEAYSTFYR